MINDRDTSELEDSAIIRAPALTEEGDPLDLREDTLVGHFRIKREIGAGGMGRVFLARDQTLGRQVALKVIRTDRHGRTERFLTEARNTAKFNHPNIVIIHSVSEYRGMPYLALEYLEGESLRERDQRQPIALREVPRIAHSIALALEHAHEKRIHHCDLKPANVMIPKDGRVRVVDFGLAKAAGEAFTFSKPARVAGTPRYMAPEQWSPRNELTPAVDIFALGVIMFELIERRHPYFGAEVIDRAAELQPGSYSKSVLRFEHNDVDSQLRDLIRACLELDPELRPTATAVAEDLKKLVDQAGDKEPLPEIPYRGLMPFDEEHARDFFGRENEVSACVERLREETMLAVVGPSGGGKSSFVRAGIIPRLREQGRLSVISMRPGATPMRTLAAHFVAAEEVSSVYAAKRNILSVDEMERRLRKDSSASAAVMSELARRERAKIVLYVDQLEEIFTHGAKPEEVNIFIEAICAAADDPKDPARVIVSLREDFLGRLPPSPLVQRAFSNVLVIRNMGREELREAILRPLEVRGYHFEDPQIVEEMLGSVASDFAGLPMLEFACRMLWERHDPSIKQIARREFEAIGGVTGALAVHAKQVLAGFNDDEKKTARQLFLELVNPEGTRRTQPREALVNRLGERAPRVIERLIGARLITIRRGQESDESGSLIELAHESLVTRWPELVRWIEESRDALVLRNEIEPDLLRWVDRGRRAQDTWDHDTVRAMRGRLEKLDFDLGDELRAFLSASEAEATLKKRLKVGLIIGGAVVLLTITTIAIVAALQQQEIALAAADTGKFHLAIQPFDWDPEKLEAKDVDASQLSLDWRLYTPDRKVSTRPGELVTAPRLSRARISGPQDHVLVDEVETPAGAAILEVFGRGPQNEHCESSWIRLIDLPGFAERKKDTPLQTIRVKVPTCAATRAGMVEIPAGEVISRGPGDPPAINQMDPEKVAWVDSFRLDKTEVPNAAFALFVSIGDMSGFEMPRYPKMGPLVRSADPAAPVTNIDSATAKAFCAFMGKRLPTSEEWEKAARGGKFFDAAGKVENDQPKRAFSWGRAPWTNQANLGGTTDGFEGVAPVNSYPNGASPYGILNLIGNVNEWTSTPWDKTEPSGHLIIRGGSWYSELASEEHHLALENSRDPRFFDYTTGFRCASDAK
jgi:eukaryotic-like serine/threonine-protein kinase